MQQLELFGQCKSYNVLPRIGGILDQYETDLLYFDTFTKAFNEASRSNK